MLNRSGEGRHACFPHDLRGQAFSLLSFTMILVLGLSCMARYIPSIPSYFRVFIMNEH